MSRQNQPDSSDPIGAAWQAFEAEDFTRAETLFRSARSDPQRMNAARGGLIFVFVRTGRFDEARDECHSLQLEAQAGSNLEAEYTALHQLGIVERLAGDLEAALRVFSAEQNLILRLESPPLAVSANAFEQGIINARLGRFETARDLLQVSLEASQLCGDAMAEACALRGLGEIAGNQTMRRALLVQSAAAFERAGDETGALEVKAMLEGSQSH